jgi:hypothetical protein
MAKFPRIESPCPLPAEQQRCVAGFCGLCGKSVQRLDDMDDRQRAAWMSQAAGPVCVSYRLPRQAIAGLAVAALFAAAPSIAGEPDAVTKHEAPLEDVSDASPDASPLTMLIMVGGIAEPSAAEWIDDTGLSDLPQRQVEGSLEERAEGAPRLDVSGSVEDTGA